jgi:hypothetical protein
MAGEHLRAVMARHAPGVSVRELCRRAGVPEHRLAYYLDPDDPARPNRRPPTIERCVEIANIIDNGCTANEVFLAIMRDLDPRAELADGLDGDERELVTLFRKLGPTERVYLRQIAAVLDGG